MKFYLSSFKLGNDIDRLKSLIPPNKKTAYISNALDMVEDHKWLSEFTGQDVSDLVGVGLDVDRFDLRKYFNDHDQLSKDIRKYGVIWVSGGNVFVLRQAFQLSGFDAVLTNLAHESDILYGGYSAGVCVLSPSLKGAELVDKTTYKPYGDNVALVWEGLNLIPFAFTPHFKSDHPESARIDKEIAYYEEHGIAYKPLKDGEVIVIE
jgi:dipeptidase E